MIRNNACYKIPAPCILVYDDYNRGRNFIVGNYAIQAGKLDLGIQCTSGVTITNNIVINARKFFFKRSTYILMILTDHMEYYLLFHIRVVFLQVKDSLLLMNW